MVKVISTYFPHDVGWNIYRPFPNKVTCDSIKYEMFLDTFEYLSNIPRNVDAILAKRKD